MTVFIAHAPQDLEVAEGLERFLERRGVFVELEDGEQAFRPLQFTDVVIALVSKDSVMSTWKLRFEQRTLEAWAEQKLILVKLDQQFAPVGLRDLPFVDASFVPRRDPFTWGEVATKVTELSRPRPPAAAGAPPPPASAPAPQAPRQRAPAQKKAAPPSAGRVLIGLAVLGIVGGVMALAASFLGDPARMASMNESLGGMAARVGLSPMMLAVIFGVGGTVLIGVVIALLLRAASPRREAGALRTQSQEQAQDDGFAGGVPGAATRGGELADALPETEAAASAVFVSYARANSPIVMPVVEEVKRHRSVWVDQAELHGGDGWAGEIVRAIRGAQSVMVMCSTAAFESDHVKREVYLADRYKKRLLPVFVEEATPPEDFEFFFAGVQWVKLFETPEGERSQAIERALGTA